MDSLETFIAASKQKLDKTIQLVQDSHAAKGILVFGVTCATISLIRDIKMNYQRKSEQLPPGYNGIPIFGSMLSMAVNNKHFLFKKLPNGGPIVSYWLGNQLGIMINDIDLVKAIFNSPICINRPSVMGEPVFKGHIQIFAFVNQDQNWYKRKMLTKNGVNNIAKRNIMDKQTQYLFKQLLFCEIDKYCKNKQLWYMREDLRNASFNMVFGSLFGEKNQLSKDNDTFKTYNSEMESSVGAAQKHFLSKLRFHKYYCVALCLFQDKYGWLFFC